MNRQVKQRIYLGDTHSFRAFRDFYNFITGSNFTFFQDSKIKTRLMTRHHQGCHLWFVHADAEAIAGHPRLRHLE